MERKGRWRGRGRVTRGSPAIINAASAAIIHFPEARKSGIFEASARGGARGSRSGWPTDKVSSKRHCTIKTIVTLLEVKICPRSGSRTWTRRPLNHADIEAYTSQDNEILVYASAWHVSHTFASRWTLVLVSCNLIRLNVIEFTFFSFFGGRGRILWIFRTFFSSLLFSSLINWFIIKKLI